MLRRRHKNEPSKQHKNPSKRHYVDDMMSPRRHHNRRRFGLHSLLWNLTYNLTVCSVSEVVDNHKTALTSYKYEKQPTLREGINRIDVDPKQVKAIVRTS